MAWKRSWSAIVALPLLIAALPAAAADIMSVNGTQLLRNGIPFRMNGVQIDAFEAPSDWYGASEANNSALSQALLQYNTTELQYAQQYGANTIDFQVGEMGLDPQNTAPSTKQRVAYSAAYVQSLQNAVQLARNMNFIVMISVADSPFSGDTNYLGLPTPTTLRANLELANLFQGDPGVILELFNEPFPVFDTTLLAHKPQYNGDNIYINGGVDNLGNSYVGVNSIIQQMRAAGSQNLIVTQIPSQYYSAYQTSPGVYPNGVITDSLQNKLAYGVHPYFQFASVGTTPAQWDASFGTFAETHPLMVTEWDESAAKVGGVLPKWCEPAPTGYGAPLSTPLQFLNYLPTRGVNGAVGWAFDMTLTLIGRYGAGVPTTMTGAVCNSVAGGVGLWLEDYFKNILPAS